MERGIVTVLFFLLLFRACGGKKKKSQITSVHGYCRLAFFLTIYQGQGWNSALSEAQTHFEPSMKTNVREMEGQ